NRIAAIIRSIPISQMSRILDGVLRDILLWIAGSHGWFLPARGGGTVPKSGHPNDLSLSGQPRGKILHSLSPFHPPPLRFPPLPPADGKACQIKSDSPPPLSRRLAMKRSIDVWLAGHF